jgi:stress response protein YsnF
LSGKRQAKASGELRVPPKTLIQQAKWRRFKPLERTYMQTILATFDDEQTARQAVDELVAEGFPRANVHLQSNTVSRGSLPGETRPGAGSNNSIMSAVGHFFSSLFESEQERAGVYSEAVRRGSTVVAVDTQTDADVERAQALLHRFDSVNVDDRAARWKSEGWKGFDAGAAPMTGEESALQRESLPVVEEEVHIGKRTVDLGGLRIIKRLSETPVSQVINLLQQKATVERTPVDRPATEADFQNFREGTFEVRETAEEAVIGKTARVVEEVAVRQVVTNRAETVSETVRKTDVDVERVHPIDDDEPSADVRKPSL